MAPQPTYCAEKDRLLDAYLAAYHDLGKLQNQEEVARSGESLAQFNLALKVARMRRDEAKKTCMEHIAKHGC